MTVIDDVSQMTDSELEDILRLAQNTHVDGSKYSRAKNELELRRSRSEQTDRERLRVGLDAHLVRINQTLDYLYRKPAKSVLIAAVGAIVIGVSVNLLSAYLAKWLHIN